MYIKSLMADEISKSVDAWNKTFEVLAEESRKETLNSLKPGQPVPPTKGINDNHRAEWKEKTEKYRAEIMEQINGYESELIAKKTAAPSEEALRSVQMFALRYDPVKTKADPELRERAGNEFDTLMTKYGDNYSTYQTLKEMAASGGIHDFKDHPVTIAHESVGSLRKNIDRTMDEYRTAKDGIPGWSVDLIKQGAETLVSD